MMNLFQYIVSLIFLCLTHSVRSQNHIPLADKSNNIKPWDILMYTQSWPITACREWEDKNPSHKCTLPYSWVVHGLWPDFQGANKGPQFCNKSWHFDPEEIRSIETELTEHWTNIEIGTPRYQFWAHEWNKHGTCAASVAALNTQFKYFNQGLLWNKQFNMTNILADSGIIPSNEKNYSVDNIENALKKKLGVAPVVQCYRKSGRNYLVEIRMCLNKSLKLIDCDSGEKMNQKIMTNCVGSEVVYPKTVETQKAQDLKPYSWPLYEVFRI